MVMLQHKLNVKLSQRQILTPGLVQMVSVLALNKIELKDMINAEMVENPVLEELEDSVPLIDDVGRREEERDRVTSASAVEEAPVPAEEKKDPFDEIDFGSFFQEYLDPGYRSQSEMEDIERPSFENFLSKPTNLTDHLMWQLGALSVSRGVREAAELIIGNLNEDGYLIATDDELMGVAAPSAPEVDAAAQENLLKEVEALGIGAPIEGEADEIADEFSARWDGSSNGSSELSGISAATAVAPAPEAPVQPAPAPAPAPAPRAIYKTTFTLSDLHEALEIVRQLDPPGVACRDLRECLLYQLRYIQQQHLQQKNGNGTSQVLADAMGIVDQHLRALQMKQHKEIAKALGRPIEAIPPALEFIKTLDPRPGQQYNKATTRLIEPDVAFIKHGDEWLCLMNDDDVPQLRLNPAYKRLLTKEANDKDTRNYVKERYKSAIQLIKNIEQRKQTIMKVCYSIVARQQDFLEKGIDQLKPMMIKEVAEEIGVHPSTVSRAVANKYAHTPQGVFELRYFFSESVQGPEGGNTSLLILKRRVKKLIEEEDPARPLTDEQITRILQSQGIQVTRRTVAKYREDMRIPSTHQRRVKK
ncbi:MAG TPA: RNA polymerase factor sigma-54 [Terriglobales bacterium]|nr:RNA polymerase factor sigma-54 [Terriglobales bacterium]